MTSKHEPTSPKPAAEEALRQAFDPRAAADQTALARVREAVSSHAAAESTRDGRRRTRGRSVRRPLYVGGVAALALVSAITAFFVLGDARTPSGSYVIERARAAQAAIRQPGMITHQRIVETYWERDPSPVTSSDIDRAFALTGTVVTETWRDYDDTSVRVEQWVERGGRRDWPMTLVRTGDRSLQTIDDTSSTRITEWIGVPSELDDRPLFRIHKAIGTPAFLDCGICHAVTADSDSTLAADGFSDESSLVQTLLRLGFLENAGTVEYRGSDAWVLRSEGTTTPADAPGIGRLRWRLEMYVERDTYRLLGARNRTWQGDAGEPMTLQFEWTFDLQSAEAVEPERAPQGLFELPSIPETGTVRYAAKVATASAGSYDRLPLYWLGPELTEEPFVTPPQTSTLLEPWFVIRSSDREADSLIDGPAGSLPGTPALTATIGYVLPADEAGGDSLLVRTYPPMSPKALIAALDLTRGERAIETVLGGHPVTLVQTQRPAGSYAFPGSVPGPYTTSAFYVHFPDATVTIDDPAPPRVTAPLTDITVTRIVERLRRAR